MPAYSPLLLGYWLPYEAARAIAAKFCWEIRYALTPVFGMDFPKSCIQPHDSKFLKLGIDKSIIHRCTQLASEFRSEMQSPSTMKLPRSLYNGPTQSLRPKPAAKSDYESGYGTDTDRSQPNSPDPSCYGWTPINASGPSRRHQLSQMYSNTATAGSTDNRPTYPTSVAKQQGKRIRSDDTHSFRDNVTTHQGIQGALRPNKRVKRWTMAEEARAAYTLVQLAAADQSAVARQAANARRASC